MFMGAGSSGRGSVSGGGEVDVGRLSWATGVGEDGWIEASGGERARGGRRLGIGDACGSGGVGTAYIYYS